MAQKWTRWDRGQWLRTVCEGRHDVRCLDFERFMRCAVGIVLSWRWFCKRLDKAFIQKAQNLAHRTGVRRRVASQGVLVYA
jgi:hypothetical protein